MQIPVSLCPRPRQKESCDSYSCQDLYKPDLQLGRNLSPRQTFYSNKTKRVRGRKKIEVAIPLGYSHKQIVTPRDILLLGAQNRTGLQKAQVGLFCIIFDRIEPGSGLVYCDT